MSRIPEYARGFKDGVSWSVTELFELADEMNDPHARAILHMAAHSIGTSKARREAQEAAWGRARECNGASGAQTNIG